MEKFNVALALDRLMPGAKYGNSLTPNTKEAYDALRWLDDRPKPLWSEVQQAGQEWLADQAKPSAFEVKTQINDLVENIDDSIQLRYGGQMALIHTYMAENNLTKAVALLGGLLQLMQDSNDQEGLAAAQPVVDYLNQLGVY